MLGEAIRHRQRHRQLTAACPKLFLNSSVCHRLQSHLLFIDVDAANLLAFQLDILTHELLCRLPFRDTLNKLVTVTG